MNKRLTDRQLWSTWQNEYKLWLRAGFNHAAAVLNADAAVAAKRAKMRGAAEDEVDADAGAEKQPG